MHGIIYALIDPRTSAVRYIGQTIKRLPDRIACHVTPGILRRHSYLSRWLGGLVAADLRPVGIPIAIANDQRELDALEIAFIAALRASGAQLVNQANGGGGRAGYVVPQDERDRIAASQRGKPKPKHTQEWRDRMSRMKLGRPSTNTPEHHKRIGDMKRGVPRTDEVKAKISKAKLGVKRGPRPRDQVERMAAAPLNAE